VGICRSVEQRSQGSRGASVEVVGEHMHRQICSRHGEQRCHELSYVEGRQGSRGVDVPLPEPCLS
jgi:hypothetical protein